MLTKLIILLHKYMTAHFPGRVKLVLCALSSPLLGNDVIMWMCYKSFILKRQMYKTLYRKLMIARHEPHKKHALLGYSCSTSGTSPNSCLLSCRHDYHFQWCVTNFHWVVRHYSLSIWLDSTTSCYKYNTPLVSSNFSYL
jgi:hypothetical protein